MLDGRLTVCLDSESVQLGGSPAESGELDKEDQEHAHHSNSGRPWVFGPCPRETFRTKLLKGRREEMNESGCNDNTGAKILCSSAPIK